MPLNFNIRPYNDDFDETKHFYRVLYRPAVAIQARELTQAQSILQQQIKYLGDSLYKHGSMVIPGQIATDPKTAYVRLKATYGFLGPDPIPVNLELFKNATIQGQTTQLKALVVATTAPVNNDPPTLYVKYLNTGLNGETVFASDEVLTLANSTVGLAQVDTNAPTGLAITAQIDEGVYYIWGYFVRVEKQYLILNKYSNIVSCRVGLQVSEAIVTPEDDISLTDNAQGFPNYAAPGAHRYKIDLTLASKLIDDTTDDTNFVELVRLLNSITQRKVVTDTYSVIAKELAQRTVDANGDFAVRNFALDVRENLDTSFVTAGSCKGSTVEVGPTPGPPAPATFKLDTNALGTDDAYNGFELYLNNGAGAGQRFYITDYIGSTKTAVLDIDYEPNKVADTTTTYVISNPAKVNRGVNPPPPFGTGDAAKLSVGLESGRAYVDGYLVNTLVTTFVDVPKARDTAQASSGQIQSPIGNYILAKNVKNIPLSGAAVPEDFLVINFSNKKATGSFDPPNDGIGTARVHAVEFYKGVSAADTSAIFKLFLFDIKMNTGQNINNARSFYLLNDVGHNNNGNGLNAWGDICAMFDVFNINGTGLVPAATITGPSGIGTETLAEYDPINNVIITEPKTGNALQILTNGSFSAPSGTTGSIFGRRQLFNAAFASLVYPMPQQMMKAIRDSGNSSRTNYYIRQMFEATRNSSGDYIFNTTPNATFAPFSTVNYLACVVSSPNSTEIGKYIDLSSYVGPASFGGSPANTQLTFNIQAPNLGGASGTVIKLMATLYRTSAGEKLKALTDTEIAYANPKAIMSLQKADVYKIKKIIDSGAPGVDADANNPAHIDIKGRYALDTGQRDYYYDVGAVYLKPGAPPPAGRLLIQFQYFSHSGSGDYFSVDSYTNQVDYANIPTYTTTDGRYLPLRDCLDFRPRKENEGLSFAGTGGSYSAPLVPNSNVIADYQYYLSRIDKIYVDQYGIFNVISGTSALKPLPPPDPLDGMMLYTIKLNPYTLSPDDMSFKATKNPRYTMHDIGKLEDRIANLEYYTNLNQLEQNTASLQITDTQTGLDRFKNGFVVDNFFNMGVANVFDPNFAASIDPSIGVMRPKFTQTTNTVEFNINASSHYATRNDINILPYTEAISIEQKFATDVVNVNPFAVFTYFGNIALIPPTDTWKDTVQRPVINLTDNSAMDGYQFVGQWSGVQWGDWQTSWVGQPTSTSTTQVSTSSVTTANGGGSVNPQDVIHNIIKNDPSHWVFNGQAGAVDIIHINGVAYATGPEWGGQNSVTVTVPVQGPGSTTTTTTTTATTVSTQQQIGQTRTGIQTMVTAQLTQQVNNQLVDSSLTPYIRSRRIKVVGRHFKPGARLYPFFDGVNVSSFCRPYQDPQITPSISDPSWTTMKITWGGDFNPEANGNQGVSEDTTDTAQTATLLVGPLNGPIYTDSIGSVTLFFEIPCNAVNKFRVGARPFRLTTDPKNGVNPDAFGDATYNASGLVDQYQETITSIYTPQIQTRSVTDTQVTTRNLGSTTTTSEQTTTTQTGEGTVQVQLTLWADPLAQSILIKEKGGIFVTKVDIYFATADESVPITMQIRSMVNGYPSQDVVPFSEKTLYPNNPVLSAINATGSIDFAPPYSEAVINVSDDASVPTSFVFDSPVYLHDGTEYAIVLIANSIKYTVYTAKIGGTVVGSTSVVSTPPYLGNLFKSQNASTWVADPTQNMKFAVHMAQFDPNEQGEIYFTNTSVQPDLLGSLPFQTVNGSNVVRVLHPNHGMPKGQFVNSVVKLSGVANGTYNGLTAAQLTGEFSIDNVDMNSYTITVSGSAALATGRVGPDGVVATKNQQYDSFCLIVNQLMLTGTSIQWFMKGLTGKSVHNNSLAFQEPYFKDTDWIPIQPNTTNDFLYPRMIASDINETTSVVGASAFDRKSFVLKALLTTTQRNLTPQVDLQRMSIVMANNQIDDPTFENYTLDPMDRAITITSTSTDSLTFQSKVIVQVVAVTGGQFVVNETVTGAVSGAQGTVLAWDSVNLTLGGVVGTFQKTEAISNGNTTVGTVDKFEYVNTITNPSGVLDFSVFLPGYSMTINGAGFTPDPSAFTYPGYVTILDVTGNQITVDTHSAPPFNYLTGQSNVQLTMYGRYVAESGPNRCTVASRYITRQFNLANPANSLHVRFTINRPPGSFVDAYYRILKTDSTQTFDTILWKPMALDATVDSGVSSNPGEFKEFVYTADRIGSFTAFAIKLVMRGGNSAQVPKIKDFRGIALAE